jgi:dipeptidyl aminopeptidase/acylaminoacyl peptidase
MFTKKTLITVLAGAALATQAAAQDEWAYPDDVPQIEPVTVGLAGEKPADIVRYLMVRGAGQTSISPDGGTVAFSYRVTGEPQLWVVDSTGGWPKQLTFGTGIRTFHWAPDGEHLLVTRDAEGNEREGYYLLSVDGTEERQLLPLSDAFRQFGMFSKDGSQFLFSSTERTGRDFDIYVTDVASGETSIIYEGSFGFFPASWQPDGDLVIVNEVRGEGTNDVHLLDMATGELTLLFHPEEPSYHSSYQWLPDGSGFFLATNQDREFAGIAHYSLKDRKFEYRETPEADIYAVELSSDGRYIAWMTNEDGYSHLHVRDRKTDEAVETPDLPPGVYGIEFASASHALNIRVTGPATPGDVFVWDIDTAKITHAVRSNVAGLDPESFVTPESLHYAARDGVPLQGFLYLPDADDFDFKPPVVVSVHGGPTAQSRPTFKSQVQYLVNNGIAVFDVNNTNRIAVMGGSYGGYMVNAVLGSYPGVFDAGASFVGVSDWVRALNEASPALKASDRIEYGDIREERWQEFYKVNSPINNAHKINVPMFVEHGVNDPRDPVTESDRIVKTIRDNGGTVTYMRFPDEGHSVSKQANRVAMYRALVGFLEEHLKPDEDQTSD